MSSPAWGGGQSNTQFIAAQLEIWVTGDLQLTFEGKAVLWVWTLNLGSLVAPGGVKIEMDC